MECNKPADIVEVKDDVNTQCDCVRGDRRRIDRDCRRRDRERVLGTGGFDSSLLFFFLILIIIVDQYDCDIELDTLMWFFLVLVAIFCKCD